MTAAEEARRFAALADIASRLAAPPEPPTPEQEEDEDPETFFARVAAARLLSEPCDG